jgi:anti-sigma factor RsiW
MPPQVENLDREATLMLYVAGELEPAAREEFERRLAAEPELAAEAEQLRAAQGAIATELERADARTRLPASEGVVVRRVSRAIAVWLAQRAVATAPPVRRGIALPWWSYPAGMAASLIVGFLVWSSRQDVGPVEPSPETRKELSAMAEQQAELADWLSTSLGVTADASADTEIERLLSSGRPDELNTVYLTSPLPEENSQ